MTPIGLRALNHLTIESVAVVDGAIGADEELLTTEPCHLLCFAAAGSLSCTGSSRPPVPPAAVPSVKKIGAEFSYVLVC